MPPVAPLCPDLRWPGEEKKVVVILNQLVHYCASSIERVVILYHFTQN